MSKKRDNKRKVEIKGYDIAKLRFQRFLAMVIDWYISNMIVAIPVTFFLRGKDYIQPYSFQLETYGYKIGMIYGLFVVVVGICYYFAVPKYIWKGQTLGKKICKLQVVKTDGQKVDTKTMFLREIIGAVVIEGGIVVSATYIRKLIGLLITAEIIPILKYGAYAITLASIIYAYFNPLSQSFHDKLARTVVIRK